MASISAQRIVMALPERLTAELHQKYANDSLEHGPHHLAFMYVTAARAVVCEICFKTHTQAAMLS
jgi:alkylhydroperoxidase/carboxymuconolactone decarboxylase family protein YurZ